MIDKLSKSDELRPMKIGEKLNELIDAYNNHTHELHQYYASQPVTLDKDNNDEENPAS